MNASFCILRFIALLWANVRFSLKLSCWVYILGFMYLRQTGTHTHTHIYIYIYIYVCVCVCVCVFQCIFTIYGEKGRGELHYNYVGCFDQSWKTHPTKQQLYVYLTLISQIIPVKGTRHAWDYHRSKGEFIRNVLSWTSTHGHINVYRQMEAYISSLRALDAM